MPTKRRTAYKKKDEILNEDTKADGSDVLDSEDQEAVIEDLQGELRTISKAYYASVGLLQLIMMVPIIVISLQHLREQRSIIISFIGLYSFLASTVTLAVSSFECYQLYYRPDSEPVFTLLHMIYVTASVAFLQTLHFTSSYAGLVLAEGETLIHHLAFSAPLILLGIRHVLQDNLKSLAEQVGGLSKLKYKAKAV